MSTQTAPLSPLYFLAASLLALLVAALAIAFQAVRAARRPPADALRHESDPGRWGPARPSAWTS